MAPVALAINTPSSLRAEHEELHAELEAAARVPGGLGQAAQAVADALHPHFAKEEMYAMPALGALPALAAGKIPRNVEEVRALAERRGDAGRTGRGMLTREVEGDERSAVEN